MCGSGSSSRSNPSSFSSSTSSASNSWGSSSSESSCGPSSAAASAPSGSRCAGTTSAAGGVGSAMRPLSSAPAARQRTMTIDTASALAAASVTHHARAASASRRRARQRRRRCLADTGERGAPGSRLYDRSGDRKLDHPGRSSAEQSVDAGAAHPRTVAGMVSAYKLVAASSRRRNILDPDGTWIDNLDSDRRPLEGGHDRRGNDFR